VGMSRYSDRVGRRCIMAITLGFAVSAWPNSAKPEEPVLVPAHQLIAGLLQIMKAGSTTPFAKRYDLLAPVVDQTFNLVAILQASVGMPTWQSLPSDQQDMLLKEFRRYTIASYVSSFNEYNGQRFLVNPETRIVGDEQVVRTKITPISGDGHELAYVMRQGPGGWKIVDVLADGAVSRVAVQRSDFRQLIRQGGASSLGQSLRTKADSLST
jgi:phospholipid transport system substrate-binding protein